MPRRLTTLLKGSSKHDSIALKLPKRSDSDMRRPKLLLLNQCHREPTTTGRRTNTHQHMKQHEIETTTKIFDRDLWDLGSAGLWAVLFDHASMEHVGMRRIIVATQLWSHTS